MKNEIEMFDKGYELLIPTENQPELILGAVNLINSFSKEKLMLPVTQKDYTILASRNTLVVAKSYMGEIVGTAAYSQFYDRDIWEFGGWAVSEGYQGQGLGINLLKKLFLSNPHFQTIAFGNKNSGPIFESLGALVVTDYSAMPQAIFGPCSICPNKPEKGCCDTIYNLEPIVSKFGMPDTNWMSPRQLDRLAYGIGENQSTQFKGFGKQPKDWY